MGWLLKALPLLAVGILAWVLVRPWVSPRSRRAWDWGWMTVLAVLPVWALHPLVRATVLSATLDAAHWTRFIMVNTGILPVSFRTANGQIAPRVGPAALVHLTAPSAGGHLVLREAVSLCWWGWAIVALIVVSPLVGHLWRTLRDDEVVPDPGGGLSPKVTRGAWIPVQAPQRDFLGSAAD